ncbi:hypothetical protein HN51_014265 [Arachis hypogaea]|uniref:Integral membrane bound transporter domain-containing protein n=1 Tax=Arachis hypogaea TaxID=3818 RepID=A0A445CQ53_ARAHY|nr:uncharacterized protein LOC112806030 [Arachis hypogaea]QHO45816.1 uncharacterized protein DS421_6g182060 [Arachis hypogaea]RYR53003.1 hypothetical protein Ahy_A06g027844 [Arachis hypogaea]
MSKIINTISSTRAEVWQARLGSALRTTLACTIVGCTSLYGPEPLRRYLEFPAFSYVTTILIVSDATLGDTLRGCCHVLFATVQVMIVSLLSLHVIGPTNFSNHTAAMMVAAGSFLVALPGSLELVAKRIAFGQLVIVHVSAAINSAAEAGVTVYPIHAASSTALGVVASILAMLLPYPRLAYYEVRKLYRLYTDNISERLNWNIDTITASDSSTAVGFSNQSMTLSTIGAKLFQRTEVNMKGMHWERPHNPHCIDPKERLQDLEVPIRGMDIALSSCTSFPIDVIDEELRGVLIHCKGRFSQKLDQQGKCFAPFDATTNLETKKEILNRSISKAYKDLPTSFFLYCLQLLLDNSPVTKKIDHMVEKTKKIGDSKRIFRKIAEVVMNFMPSTHNLVFAFKCSLSLGLAVFFGLTYNKENGYWSGLTIAISFDTRRQPTFSVANARGQGTAMGSIYGVLCCSIFHKYADLRFLPLLPWLVFYTFLRHSKMYGQSGAISAVIGASLILGRKHYGPPTQFAITRITEATIGLVCFIIVEILVSPSRATTLAKTALSESLGTLQDCITKDMPMPSISSQALREGQNKMKSLVCQLEAFIAEADLEPNFWFLPFHGACYQKMLESLSRTADLLLFVAYSMEQLTQLSQKGNGGSEVDLQNGMNETIENFKNKVGPTLKCLEEITKMKSLKKLEKELKKRNLPCDIESGEYPNAETFLIGDEDVEIILGTFFKHLEGITSRTHTNRDEEMLFHYSCLGFCISNLVREIIKIENQVRELIMWENPSNQANMKEICCKISTLCSLS